MPLIAATVTACLATAGCSVPRPVASSSASLCALPTRPLAIDLGGGGVGAALAGAPSPAASLLARAAEARTLGPAAVGRPQPLATQLVLSGGGQHGAFGSGFLAGLDPLPAYDVVTGVSTGALQAPLALLGNEAPPADRLFDPAEDFPGNANQRPRRNIDDLVTGYTISRESTLYRSRGVGGVIRRAALGDLVPLRRRVATLITDQTLRRLAELDPGQRGLFVLLLDWDSGIAQQVDMLALARRHASGDRNARDCFIDVMIAASSEPLGAPPVAIDKTLYVDAGLRFGVFARQAAEDADAAAAKIALGLPGGGARRAAPLVRTDMIRNGDITIGYDAPSRYSALDTVNRGRSILVNQVYAFSMRDVLDRAGRGHQVRFAFITPQETDAGKPAKGAVFDPDYMKRMLNVGKDRGKGDAWNLVRPADGPQ